MLGHKSIPYGKQEITDSDIEAVVKVLQSDYLTQGPKVREFEEAFANYVGAKHAVAVSSGTAALHLSVMALGANKNDQVLSTPITFAATSNAVLYSGANINFVDIDANTFLMDLNKLEENLKKQVFRGIIPVDFTGLAVNMEEVRYLADKHGCWVLEDACHAPGGSFLNASGKNVKCGSGQYSDLSIFSFHPVKHIATGEGGMITTNDPSLAEKLKRLRTHGITKNPGSVDGEAFGWVYEMTDLGYNYRLNDIQSVLGISQLKRAGERLNKRRILAQRYNDAFNTIPQIRIQQYSVETEQDHHAFHLYVILAERRNELYDYLHSEGIRVQVHYIPVYKLRFYRSRYGDISLPNTEEYYKTCLTLPLYPTLLNEEQDFIINKIEKFFGSGKQ